MTNKLNMPYVWTICLVAACGGLLFGYDWVVIGGAKPFYEAYFGITDPAQSGWAMSSALVGCIFGAVISGLLSDRFGRKLPLAIAALTFVIDVSGSMDLDNRLGLVKRSLELLVEQLREDVSLRACCLLEC